MHQQGQSRGTNGVLYPQQRFPINRVYQSSNAINQRTLVPKTAIPHCNSRKPRLDLTRHRRDPSWISWILDKHMRLSALCALSSRILMDIALSQITCAVLGLRQASDIRQLE